MEKNIKKTNEDIRNTKAIRIIVFRSNKEIYAQAFDISAGNVLVSSSSLKIGKKNPIECAKEVGSDLAKKISKLKASYVFDRRKYLYHGQVKALAEGLRQGGINI